MRNLSHILDEMADEAPRIRDAIAAAYVRLSPTRTAHRLYKTGDPDAPDVIKDRNGHVALDLCRVCGRAESLLSERCEPA
ncbi:hypothetical protein [Microvirga massiliensis]|uniref:hypothetical protein n=1 Tax=Microvirga massiliensis TaxID=1033741 RepID=UPI000ADE11E2|nr:hypothetical protein [Microvirga massiliensis]